MPIYFIFYVLFHIICLMCTNSTIMWYYVLLMCKGILGKILHHSSPWSWIFLELYFATPDVVRWFRVKNVIVHKHVNNHKLYRKQIVVINSFSVIILSSCLLQYVPLSVPVSSGGFCGDFCPPRYGFKCRM